MIADLHLFLLWADSHNLSPHLILGSSELSCIVISLLHKNTLRLRGLVPQLTAALK